MADSNWWEKCVLGITVLGYALLAFNAFRNRRNRLKVSEQSKTMSECERCSVELVRGLVPQAKVPDYRFRGMRLKMPAIRVGFDNVGVKLKSNGRCILQGVTGEFRPKRVAAIMGLSGAGKTTFMNALCGRAYYGTTSGEIRINGHVSSIAEIKQLRGFVPQDDIVHEHLTVREQLYYSARLRNAEKTSKQMINSIVEDVLNVMQLLDVQDSIVGNVERRGISGGQRKRVNIGLELAARPSILMLDEPTSGLDATTALDIIRSVKRLTAIGMTVVMVVHQPRYSLFTLFDEVLLLGGGQTVYLGPSEGALPYFRNLGFKMPQHENPADWFMDVIAGKVKNEHNPALSAEGLPDAWAESITNIMPTDMDAAHEAVQGHNDRMEFAKALNAKLFSAGIEDADVLNDKQFAQLMAALDIEQPSNEALAHLKERMGFNEGIISKSKVVTFLLGLLGSFSQDAEDKETIHASESSATTKESSTNAIPDGEKLGRSGRFCLQFPILLHQNSIRWARNWRHKVISTGLIMFAAAVFGQPCKDKLLPDHVLCPIKINISHVAIGALTGVACLHIFGSDRPLFWRESASGVGVSAFFLSRVMVYLFDVLVWCYAYTGLWMVFSEAPCSYWMWLIAFRMTAVSAAGVGVLMSTLVPKQNATLATACVLLVMGGAISEPQVIADATGVSSALAFLSPFTWTSGENYLAVIASKGGESVVDEYAVPIMEGYKKILLVAGGTQLGYVTAAYISCSVFGFLALTFGYLGLRCSHRGKQA